MPAVRICAAFSGTRSAVGAGLSSPGFAVTAILKSSTATGLMATSFAAGGLVGLVPALAVMLGANLGTTLVVQLLSFNIGRVAPLFVLIEVILILFRRSLVSRMGDLGGMAIGLGLMLVALPTHGQRLVEHLRARPG